MSHEAAPPFQIVASPELAAWLSAERLSLLISTYQMGKVFAVGTTASGELSVLPRTFEQSMGIAQYNNQLYLAGSIQIWQFENILANNQTLKDYDAWYQPRNIYYTGNLDTHDLAVEADGRLIFVNTQYNCLATLSADYSFECAWLPPFISKLIHEDRCHLNGVAIRDGKHRYVTCASRSDIFDGWRDRRNEGGIVVDTQSNHIIASGLSMPHSPRYFAEKLWVLNSGTGHFGFINMAEGEFEAVQFLPGYLRGLGFYKHYAIIGLSKPRNASFQGLQLEDNLQQQNAQALCGVVIVNLQTGNVEHHLHFADGVEELYDVNFLQNVKRPQVVGFEKEEIWLPIPQLAAHINASIQE